MPVLRQQVRVELQDGGAHLVDTCSGFTLALGVLPPHLLDALRTGALVDANPKELVDLLSACGLLDDGLGEDDIERRQEAARESARDDERLDELKEALAFAKARVPLIRERLAAVDLAGIDSLAGFAQLPETSKRDIRKGFPEQVLADDVALDRLLEDKVAFLNATSGSSDDRLEVISDARVPVLPADYFTFFALPRAAEVTRAAVLTSPVCAGFECTLGRATMAERTRGSMLTLNSSDDMLAVKDREVDAILGELATYAPRALFVNPWYATALVVAARRRGIPVPHVPLVLSTYQHLTHRQRALLTETFAAKVFSLYSATELGGFVAATECHRGRLHVREDHVHVEIAPPPDDLSKALPAGVGRVLVTTKKNRILPLVRYAVGDLARRGARCDCEMADEWATLELHGRANDLLIAPDGRALSLLAIDDALGVEAPLFYRVIQETQARYRFEALRDVGDDDACCARAASLLAGLLGEGAIVNHEAVAHLAPERSLKFRQVVRAPPAGAR
jgi:phenylacetate-CoA ligase